MRRILTLCLILFWPLSVSAQEEDVGFLAGVLQDALSDAGRSVEVRGFEGALSSQAQLETLTIADDMGVWLTLRAARLTWNRAALLQGSIEITELSAEEIIIARAPLSPDSNTPTPEASGFSIPTLPALPVSVIVGDLRADRLVLGADVLGQEAVLSLTGQVQLIEGTSTARFDLRRIDGPLGEIALSLDHNRTDDVIALDLSVAEDPGGLIGANIGLPGNPSLALTIAGRGPTDDFAADITLATNDAPRLTGDLRLLGDSSGQRLSAEVGGDLRPLVTPKYHRLLGPDARLVLEASFGAQGSEIDDAHLTTSALDLRISGALDANALPLRLNLIGEIADPEGTRLTLPIAEASLAHAAIMAGYDRAKGEGWQITAEMTDLALSGATLPRATLDIEGAIGLGQPFSVGADMALQAQDLTLADVGITQAIGPDLRARGRIDWSEGAPLVFSALEIAGATLGMTASGQADLRRGGVHINLTGQAQADDLALITPISGAVQGDLTLSADLLGGSFAAQITGQGQDLAQTTPSLAPILAGQTQLDIRARRDETGLTLQQVTLSNPQVDITGRADIASSGSDAALQLHLPKAGVLPMMEQGDLALELVARHRPNTPWRVEITGQGSGLASEIDSLNPLLRGSTQISATGLLGGSVQTLETARLATDEAQITASGTYSADGIAAKIQAQLRNSALFTGGVAGPANVDIAVSGPDANQLTLRLEGTGDNLGIGTAALDDLLRGRTAFDGVVALDQGRVTVQSFQAVGAALKASAQGQISPDMTLEVATTLDDIERITPSLSGSMQVTGTVEQAPDGYGIALRSLGPGTSQVTATGIVAKADGSVDLTLNGQLPLGLANQMIAPRVASGEAQIALTLVGQPGLGALRGQIQTGNGRLVLPTLAQVVAPIAAEITLTGDQAALDITGDMAGGQLRMAGPIRLSQPYTATLRGVLDGVTLSQSGLFETRVAGDFGIDGPLLGEAALTAQIGMFDTEVRLPNTSLSGIEAIPEMTHIAEPESARASRDRAGLIAAPARSEGGSEGGSTPPYRVNVQVIARDPVFVRGRGLDAELGGGLTLAGTLNDLRPIGSLDLRRGRFLILGQRLDLVQGGAVVSGDFDAQIRLVAQTQTEDYTISAVIEGPISAPEIRFSSTPELPEEEVLAQLIFGRDLSKLSVLQAAQLAAAVAQTAGRGNGGVLARLRDEFGLDDLDVTTDKDGETSVRAGAYVSENVYTDVEVNTQGVTDLNINLDLTPNIAITGSAGTDGNTSLGLFFQKDY